MDERTAAILEEAFATVERVERDQEQRAREPRPQVSWEPPVQRRQLDGGLIYKTTEQPERKAAMDPDTAAGWNLWVDARIRMAVRKGFEDFATIMGQEAALQENRIVARAMQEIKGALDEIKRLDREIADLRAEIEILRTAKNVTPLRSRDVA